MLPTYLCYPEQNLMSECAEKKNKKNQMQCNGYCGSLTGGSTCTFLRFGKYCTWEPQQFENIKAREKKVIAKPKTAVKKTEKTFFTGCMVVAKSLRYTMARYGVNGHMRKRHYDRRAFVLSQVSLAARNAMDDSGCIWDLADLEVL